MLDHEGGLTSICHLHVSSISVLLQAIAHGLCVRMNQELVTGQHMTIGYCLLSPLPTAIRK